MDIFDDTACALGEGPLWHPKEGALYWFDIVGQRLMRQKQDTRSQWQFDLPVSAAGWVDEHTLLVASAQALLRFDTRDGDHQVVAPLEHDNAVTRSNDGRADCQGGFWIGTMGLQAEKGAGAIYRYYRGEVRKLFDGVTIPNAICFPAGGEIAYFADSANAKIMRQDLDPETGWPVGAPQVFVDLTGEATPDGAVVDRDGCLWNAQWGASRVARYAPDGTLDQVLDVPTAHVTCPAFGGTEFADLFVTTAQQGLDTAALAAQPLAGQVFVTRPGIAGLAENRVTL